MRALLKTEFGVNPDLITWVVDDEEHVTSFKPPSNVVKVAAGQSLVEMFRDGEIDAALTGAAGVGRAGPPTATWRLPTAGLQESDFYPLFHNTLQIAADAYKATGVYPLHALLAIKSDAIADYPDLPVLLMTALERSKQKFLESLRRGTADTSDLAHYDAVRKIVGGDPLPFGVDANRPSIDALLDAAVDQHILHTRPNIDALFEA